MLNVDDPLHGSKHWSQQTAPDWVWASTLTLLTLLFFLLFFNRFAGLRSGSGEFTTGMWFLRGQIPYRDYFSATPPLNTLKAALLLKTFGPQLIVDRVAGVMERAAIALLLYGWLSRLFSRSVVFSASLATIILSAGDLVDPLASYNHDAILWAIVSGYAASFTLDDTDERWPIFWPLLSGMAAALSFITKQTVGLGAVLCVPVIVSLLQVNARSRNKLTRWVLGFSAGCSLPMLALALWLHHVHSFKPFLVMAFLKGPAAKGGHLTDFLRRDLVVAQENWALVLPGLAVLACALRPILRSRSAATENSAGASSHSNWLQFLYLAFAFTSAIVLAKLLSLSGVGALHNLSKVSVYAVFPGVSLLLVTGVFEATRSVLPERKRQVTLFAAVSFSIAFFLSLSWPAFEAMALPGLGLMVAATLSGLAPAGRKWLYGLLALLVFFQVCEKLDVPFGFDGLNENPVRLAVVPSPIPELRGMRLSPEMNAFLEETLKTIAARTKAGDTIFTYPEMSLFYVLANRTYPTFAASHNVDVVNDAMADEEALRLLGSRPAVLVYMPLTPEEVLRQDNIWRFGRQSGQHRLVQAVEQLARSYRLAGVYSVGQDARRILVYVRP